ncbi:MAG: putative holin [Gammaproteobacteria bacterium]|nr:putative holin [Gammaproteobacteria bacterium]MBU1505797.1 putative holin [Gammaproteobacteria bacterium]MBU2119485.1 putative holin [Gammaproteobacteria bacterium]MBU2172609.1 putative holin [Gammaproteobacteria bacterium]MBU2202067.1 putative holin [Gammaproteobacteria bacterium]
MREIIPAWLRAPRTSTWLVVAAILLVCIAIVAPVQLPVVLYKACLVALAAVLGYWLDRALFPYARPDGYLHHDWRYGTEEPEGDVDYPVVQGYIRVFTAAMLRRAIVVGCVVLGMAAGL